MKKLIYIFFILFLICIISCEDEPVKRNSTVTGIMKASIGDKQFETVMISFVWKNDYLIIRGEGIDGTYKNGEEIILFIKNCKEAGEYILNSPSDSLNFAEYVPFKAEGDLYSVSNSGKVVILNKNKNIFEGTFNFDAEGEIMGSHSSRVITKGYFKLEVTTN